MGWNTTVLLYNDQIHRLEEPDAGKRILKAVQNLPDRDWAQGKDPSRNHHMMTNFGFGMAVEHHHADSTAVVHVGGNYAERVHLTFGYRFNDPQMQLRLLREQADLLGYRLVRKAGNP